jgi:hypothetical protein
MASVAGRPAPTTATELCAKLAAPTRAHWRKQARSGCHTCGHVPTRAHGCAAGAAFHTISAHRDANEMARRAAGYNSRCRPCTRCRAVSRGGANAARNAGDGLAAGEALLSRCGIGGHAAAELAAAARARGREQLRTGCHGCVQVRTGAHGCAAYVAFQTVSQLAVRTSWRSAQLVIKRCNRPARVDDSCRETGRTLLPTNGDGVAGEVPRSRCGGLRVPQPSQLQPPRAHWHQV